MESSIILADTKTVEFQGRVTAIDPAAKTISIRARQKEFVFNIIPSAATSSKKANPAR